MGTKIAPGLHDCYARALPDEEMFILLARDPLAPFFASIWSAVRMGDWEKAGIVFETMIDRAGMRYAAAPDVDAANDAMKVSLAMFAWRAANDGRWREPQPAAVTGSDGPIQLLEIGPDGYAQISHAGEVEGRYVYTGVRAACIGADPLDPGRVIVAMDGGAADIPGEVPDGVVFRISPAGLQLMALELFKGAEAIGRSAAIDIRKVI